MMRTITIDADVDIGDALYASTVDELRNELRRRGDDGAVSGIVTDAINQIRRGEYADAITTLEREFMPKWSSVSDCRESFAKAML